jgi:hypothetical protein
MNCKHYIPFKFFSEILVGVQLLVLGNANNAMAGDDSLLQATVYAGATVPMADLSKNISEGGYGFAQTGYSIWGKLSFAVHPLPVAIVAVGSFQKFPSSGVFVEVIGPGVYQNGYDASMQIATLGFGVEYDIFPMDIVFPYLEADALLALIDARRTFDSKSLDPGTTHMQRATRFGIALGAGARVHLVGLPCFLELSGKYHVANLTGRQPHNSSVVWDLDDRGSSEPGFSRTDRSLNSFTILMGFGFVL